MLKIHVDARAKCKRHPSYDPAKQGRAGIIGGCGYCEDLLLLYTKALDFEREIPALFFHRAEIDPDHRYAAPAGDEMISGSATFQYREPARKRGRR